jgi:hypothetical protein
MPTNAAGKHFSSKFRMNRAEKANKPENKGATQQGREDTDPTFEHGESATQVAKEHGNAHEIKVKHDHEGGKHTVSSKHPDGHAHESEHGSADEAHTHAAGLAGVQVPGQEEGAPEAGGDEYQPPALD